MATVTASGGSLSSTSSNKQQVRVLFQTQIPEFELPDQPGPILVPTYLERQNLSALVNDLLSTSPRIPFEFHIDGYPLRKSLEDFLNTHYLSAEAVLTLEYAPAQLPPQHQASFPHDDIIGAVDVLSNASSASVESGTSIPSGHERILTASHDGCARVWNMSGQVLATTTGATAPDQFGNRRLEDGRLPMLNAAKFITPSRIVAGGWRLYLRLWDYNEAESASAVSSSAALTPVLDLHGHTMSVNSLAAHAPSSRILSAAEDGTALFWSSNPHEQAAPPPNARLLPGHTSSGSAKRRKLSQQVPSKGPLQELRGHKGPCKAVIFHPQDPSVAYTASSDSTVLTWDLETGRSVSSRTPGGPHGSPRALCALRELGLLAVGMANRRILLADPREGAKWSAVGSLKGHRNAITSLDADPESQWGLCSGSMDGCVRVWDVRTAKGGVGDTSELADGGGTGHSTFRIPREGSKECDRIAGGVGVKVLGVRWDADVGIVSGGADRRVQIDRVKRGGGTSTRAF